MQLAEAAGDPAALATAKLALHDALWQPGTARARLPVVDEMLAAAIDADDAELVALAHQLRASGADRTRRSRRPGGTAALRHPGRNASGTPAAGGAALTRQATFAQIAGPWTRGGPRPSRHCELGRAIGEPDAEGCFDTLRGSLVALGGGSRRTCWAGRTPCGRCSRCSRAWPPPPAENLDAAREALGDFSVLDVIVWTGLEALAVAAVVFAAVGSPEQRRWAYERLLPFAGTHVVVGGCAAYHAAVDHHLGVLAAALGDRRTPGLTSRGADDASPARGRGLGAAVQRALTGCSLGQLPDNEFRSTTDNGWCASPARSSTCRTPRACMTWP